MWRDAAVMAGKDLRIEVRSRVATNQVAPFALLVLVLFAFALDPDRGVLARAAATDGARDSLRLSGLDPAAIFLGKAGAIAAELAMLEVLLGAGVVVLYGRALHGPVLLVATCVLATIGLAAVGTVYGALAAGLRVRETLLPLLLLPVVAPVLLAATRASEAALGGSPGDGWPWVRLLGVFAVIYVAFGVVAFGPLLEESS